METQNNNSSNTANNNMLMCILSYLGILVIIPFLMAKNDASVKFHLKQGIVLAGIWVAAYLLGMFTYVLWPVLQLVNFALIILSIIGIINVVQGHEKPLPLVGSLVSYIPSSLGL